MAVGTSILLIAIGAILKWAVHDSLTWVSVHTTGVILMVAGLVGLIVSVIRISMWSRRRGVRGR